MKTKDQFNKELAHLCDVVEANSIWRPASVTQEPETSLTQWRVMKVNSDFNTHKDTIHFVGYAGYEGRVSSSVQEYDSKTKRGITKSGRIYELTGNSGFNGDAAYVWNMWVNRLGTDAVATDVTKEYE